MKKIVIVSYYDNNSSLVGGLRCFELYEYLRSKGYNVEILTAETFDIVSNRSRSMIKKVVSKLNIDYSYEFNRHVIKKILSDSDVSVIITSSPPHGVHYAGIKIKKLKNELYWISDFRDPFTLNEGYKKGLLSYRDNIYEKKVYTHSDLVVFNSDKHMSDHMDVFRSLKNKSVVIRNGYGEFVSNQNKLYEYCYFGGVYDGKALQGLKNIFDKMKRINTDFICDFYGEYHSLMKNIDSINYAGLISYNNVKHVMPLYKYGFIYLEPKYLKSYRVAQKFYDYLGAGVFPVCINASYEMKKIIDEIEFGCYINEEDLESIDIKQFMVRVEYKKNIIKKDILKYSRYYQNSVFEKILVNYI